MRKAPLLLVFLLLLLLVAVLLWWYGPWRRDDFDYRRAFEPVSAAVPAPAADFPLAAVAGATRAAVRDLLGEPQRCEPAQHSERCHYPAARAQIVYIDGKADWIGMAFDDEEPLKTTTLRRFGLPVTDPDEVSEQVNVWRGLGSYREVRVIDGGYGENLLFIKVATP